MAFASWKKQNTSFPIFNLFSCKKTLTTVITKHLWGRKNILEASFKSLKNVKYMLSKGSCFLQAMKKILKCERDFIFFYKFVYLKGFQWNLKICHKICKVNNYLFNRSLQNLNISFKTHTKLLFWILQENHYTNCQQSFFTGIGEQKNIHFNSNKCLKSSIVLFIRRLFQPVIFFTIIESEFGYRNHTSSCLEKAHLKI